MVTGILLFVALYVALDQSDFALRLRAVPSLKLTMRITYGLRIAMSVAFPVGLFADVFCGMAAVQIVSLLGQSISLDSMENGPRDTGFWTCLIITLVQGVLLNIVLLGIATPIFGLLRLIRHTSRKHADAADNLQDDLSQLSLSHDASEPGKAAEASDQAFATDGNTQTQDASAATQLAPRGLSQPPRQVD